MKSTPLSLIAVATALAAVTGFAVLSEPGDTEAPAATSAPRLPVERSTLLCPAPSTSDLAETTYTSFTPKGDAAGRQGSAELVPAGDAGDAESDNDDKTSEKAEGKEKAKGDVKPFLSLKGQGEPAVAEESGAEAPALVGVADGKAAPGWTVQQTTSVSAGTSRGLLGATCTAPEAEFWFPGASTAKERADYVHLTNPDDRATVVDIKLYGKEGVLKSDVGEGFTVPAHGSVPVLLSTLTDEAATDLTVHVTTRTGRIGASVHVTDEELPGADWLQASTVPSDGLVLPGIPADATDVRLIAFTPGEDDADLKVGLAGKAGSFAPAGHETLHVKSGMTAAVDLGDVTRGEPGSLVLSQDGGASRTSPVVAALRITRGKGADKEFAFIPAAAPVGARATAADNRAKGSVVSLVAPVKGKNAKVKITASAGSGGGGTVSKTYTVKGGTTTAFGPPVPSGLKGVYALTVEPAPGSGPVYAARTLELPENGIPMFTVQTLADDRGTVEVPGARQDLSVLD